MSEDFETWKREKMTLRNYAKIYFCCCIFNREKDNPTRFDDNSMKYRAFFGIFHIQHVLLVLTILKTIMLFVFLIAQFSNAENGLEVLTACFAFFTVCITNIFLMIGIRLKRYEFLIPYFTVCVLCIFVLILHLFVNFLGTINSKNETPMSQLIVLLFVIFFEIYMLTIVWRAFVYICDYNMQRQIEKVERKKSVVKSFIDYDSLKKPQPVDV